MSLSFSSLLATDCLSLWMRPTSRAETDPPSLSDRRRQNPIETTISSERDPYHPSTPASPSPATQTSASSLSKPHSTTPSPPPTYPPLSAPSQPSPLPPHTAPEPNVKGYRARRSRMAWPRVLRTSEMEMGRRRGRAGGGRRRGRGSSRGETGRRGVNGEGGARRRDVRGARFRVGDGRVEKGCGLTRRCARCLS